MTMIDDEPIRQPDPIDQAAELTARLERYGIEAAREAAAAIPVGAPGECAYCGEWAGRLVLDACAPCRDRYKLP